MQKGQVILWLVVGLLIIGLVAGGAYYLGKQTAKPQGARCTLEAKICPDGSSVGRTGPNCEFAQCPAEKVDETANWKTYTNTSHNFSIKYPNKLTYEINEGDIWFLNPDEHSEFPNATIVRVLNLKDGIVEIDKVDKYKEDGKQWKNISIGDLNGTYVEHSGGIAAGLTAILKTSDNVFYFHLVNRTDDQFNTNQDFYQMLATFKFLK